MLYLQQTTAKATVGCIGFLNKKLYSADINTFRSKFTKG